MVRSVFIFILYLFAFSAFASPDPSDSIVLEGKQELLNTKPFDQYLEQNPTAVSTLAPLVQERCTIVSIRNYTAQWEIKGQQLFLTSLNRCRGDAIPLRTFFQNSEGPVPATWFSGKLAIPRGQPLNLYTGRYERYVEIMIIRGRVSAYEIVPDATNAP